MRVSLFANGGIQLIECGFRGGMWQQTTTKTALNELYTAISKQEKTHPEAALLVVGDFNARKLKSVLAHFYQHVKCATKERKILDHLYSTHIDAYKALPRPPFGKSDQIKAGSTSDLVYRKEVR